MMRCEFLANVELCEEDLEHGGRLPMYAHAIEVHSHVWVFVHGVSVPEVDDKFSDYPQTRDRKSVVSVDN